MSSRSIFKGIIMAEYYTTEELLEKAGGIIGESGKHIRCGWCGV